MDIARRPYLKYLAHFLGLHIETLRGEPLRYGGERINGHSVCLKRFGRSLEKMILTILYRLGPLLIANDFFCLEDVLFWSFYIVFYAWTESWAEFDALEWIALLAEAVPVHSPFSRWPQILFWLNKGFSPRKLLSGLIIQRNVANSSVCDRSRLSWTKILFFLHVQENSWAVKYREMWRIPLYLTAQEFLGQKSSFFFLFKKTLERSNTEKCGEFLCIWPLKSFWDKNPLFSFCPRKLLRGQIQRNVANSSVFDRSRVFVD